MSERVFEVTQEAFYFDAEPLDRIRLRRVRDEVRVSE
jgi:hypothetical protein